MKAEKKTKPRRDRSRAQRLAELEAGLSPEAKATLAEIRAIRKAIGPVITDSGDLLRQLNEQDE